MPDLELRAESRLLTLAGDLLYLCLCLLMLGCEGVNRSAPMLRWERCPRASRALIGAAQV